MRIQKYRYYFTKPKSEITKDVLIWLATGGAVYISASSPYFIRNLLKTFPRWKKRPKKKISDTFYNLKKQGLIEIRKRNQQIYISLTNDGMKKAGMFQINNLRIKKTREWDKKWRIVIFDIAQIKKSHREAFRGKLKELGFKPLQKSVWVYPFDCRAEIELLRDFFGLSEKEINLIVAEKIDNEKTLQKDFKLTYS